MKDIKLIFSLSPYRQDILHIVIASLMLFYILIAGLIVSAFLPYVSELRPNAPPISPIGARIATFGIFALWLSVWFCIYLYIGYNFYLGRTGFVDVVYLNIKVFLVLWPLIWWKPVYIFCLLPMHKEYYKQDSMEAHYG